MEENNPQDNPQKGLIPENSNSKGKSYENWGKTKRWGYGQDQPSGAAKSAGKLKAKRNRELAQMLLGQRFIGQVAKVKEDGTLLLDDKGNIILEDSPFKKKLMLYFGLNESQLGELTNEAAMMLRMIGQAVEQGDTTAAQTLMDRAYGKPKEFIQINEGDDDKPIIQINIVNSNHLQIKENELQIGDGTGSAADTTEKNDEPGSN